MFTFFHEPNVHPLEFNPVQLCHIYCLYQIFTKLYQFLLHPQLWGYQKILFEFLILFLCFYCIYIVSVCYCQHFLNPIFRLFEVVFIYFLYPSSQLIDLQIINSIKSFISKPKPIIFMFLHFCVEHWV